MNDKKRIKGFAMLTDINNIKKNNFAFTFEVAMTTTSFSAFLYGISGKPTGQRLSNA